MMHFDTGEVELNLSGSVGSMGRSVCSQCDNCGYMKEKKERDKHKLRMEKVFGTPPMGMEHTGRWINVILCVLSLVILPSTS